MSPENFVYWLQGFFELKKTIDHREGATPETLKVIEDHLALVLEKKTPNRNIENKKEKTVEELVTEYIEKKGPPPFIPDTHKLPETFDWNPKGPPPFIPDTHKLPETFDWNPKCDSVPDATGVSVDSDYDGFDLVISPSSVRKC